MNNSGTGKKGQYPDSRYSMEKQYRISQKCGNKTGMATAFRNTIDLVAHSVSIPYQLYPPPPPLFPVLYSGLGVVLYEEEQKRGKDCTRCSGFRPSIHTGYGTPLV